MASRNEYPDQQTSVQEHREDHAHRNHLHQASRQRCDRLALDMDREPATQDHDGEADRDGAGRLGHAHDDVAGHAVE
jgi:hypothetical protein